MDVNPQAGSCTAPTFDAPARWRRPGTTVTRLWRRDTLAVIMPAGVGDLR